MIITILTVEKLTVLSKYYFFSFLICMFSTNLDFNKCDTNIPVIDEVRGEN